MKKLNYLKAGFAAFMAIYGILCVKNLPESSMLDGVNMVAHEAGHLLFGWLGQFIGVIGGTLGQLLVPVSFTVYFYLRRELFSTAAALFWVGQNFFSISVYIKDAQALDLPLVSVGGGEDTIHDWHYILSRIGLLTWDHALGNVALSLGVLIAAAAVVWAFLSSRESEEEA